MTTTLDPTRVLRHIDALIDALEETREFLDNYIDVTDGDGGPVPNRAMALDSQIDEVLAQVKGERWPR